MQNKYPIVNDKSNSERIAKYLSISQDNLGKLFLDFERDVYCFTERKREREIAY